MIRFLLWVLEVIALLWLLRLLWRSFGGGKTGARGFGDPGMESPLRSSHAASGPPSTPRELKKDPQCGTYVSPELSIRSRYRGEEIHFCSRECEQKFFQIQTEQSS